MGSTDLPEYRFKQPAERRKFDRTCDDCGKPTNRINMRIKRVRFVEPGKGGRVVRQRTTKFLCIECMERDPDYNRAALDDSPGYVGVERKGHHGKIDTVTGGPGQGGGEQESHQEAGPSDQGLRGEQEHSG